jgi:superfamily II DNA or RNA helicase
MASMKWDWSEAWLQQAAGWKPVKEGKRLLANGAVVSATMTEDGFSGVVQSGKSLKVNIVRTSSAVVEVVCGCLENRKNGTFCEHAVAVILAATQDTSKSQASTSRPTPETEQVRIPAFEIELPPRWQELALLGRWSVKLSPSTSPASESDKRLFEWLLTQGVKKLTAPIVLSLNHQTIVSFLDTVFGHAQINDKSQAIVWKEMPEAECTMETNESILMLKLLPSSTRWKPLRRSAYFIGEQGIARISSTSAREIAFTLFTEETCEIVPNQLFNDQDIQDLIRLYDTSNWLDRWPSEAIPALVDANAYGTIDKPQIRLTAMINGRPAPAQGTILHCDMSGTSYCDKQKFQASVSWLKRNGWQRVGESDSWKLVDEIQVMNFWDSGHEQFSQLVDTWDIAPGLAVALSKFTRIDAHLSSTEQSGQISVTMGFRTEAGKDLQSDKILQLLRSGKRMVQTNDGSTLLLPKESWEAFQATVSQAHWKENRGAYLLQKSQERLLRIMRENIHRSIDNESFIKNPSAQSAIDKLSQVTLRNYQEQGIHWLHDRLQEEGFALLADEMGLGKTLQSIALVTTFASPNEPALVLMPTSLLGNWRSEIEKFQPSLKTYVHHGDKRNGDDWDQGYSVIVTSYKVLSLDRALFMKRTFSLVILDEASLIRNPDTDAVRACFRLSAKRRLALTGTPVENHLRDLWSIFQFLQPGYLGERKAFEQRFCGPQRSAPDDKALQWRTKPYILRRTKDLVAGDLPAKIEIDEWCELSTTQQEWYRGFADEGMALMDRCESDAQARMQMLTLILRLRQTCCDLALLDESLVQIHSLEQRSSKMLRLCEIINESLENGRKVLVFSQFSRQLQLIRQVLLESGVANLLLDGSTSNRSELVEEFQRPEGAGVFLVSLKAGGYGLNLTAASTVVLFEPWWNPAVEKQATDRAHRIGQTKSVNVYRLLTRGSMEERVKRFQESKNQLMAAVMDDPALFGSSAISQEEIRQIFSMQDFT